MKSLLCELQLVFPPFSNQEGEWLWDDKEVREYVKDSKLYMIVHRKELKFCNYDGKDIANTGVFKFKLKLGNIKTPFIYFDIKPYLASGCDTELDLGDKYLRIIDIVNSNIIYWATPDKIIYDFLHEYICLFFEESYDLKSFQKYELYYVGISKEGDSFSRLFEKAHHGRLHILSNENSKNKYARITDELMILLFKIKWFNINIIDNLNELNYYTDDEKLIIADAEKAFIKLLDTKYNQVKYNQYPRGNDGLHKEGLSRYCYSIDEDLVLYTKGNLQFVGAQGIESRKDIIFVENDKAVIVKLS